MKNLDYGRSNKGWFFILYLRKKPQTYITVSRYPHREFRLGLYCGRLYLGKITIDYIVTPF